MFGWLETVEMQLLALGDLPLPISKLTLSHPGINFEGTYKAPYPLLNETRDLMLSLVLRYTFLVVEMDLHIVKYCFTLSFLWHWM